MDPGPPLPEAVPINPRAQQEEAPARSWWCAVYRMVAIYPGLSLGPNFREKSLLPELKIGRSEETSGRSEAFSLMEIDTRKT